MFRDPQRNRLLLLGEDPALAGLERTLGALRPALALERAAGPAAGWIGRLAEPDRAGVVAHCDSLAPGDQAVLASWLAARPELEALLVVGGRSGSAAAPASRSGVRLLPEPVTLAALEALLADPADASASAGSGAGEDALFGGVVEGMRDPLTSLSGSLQLLAGGAGEELRGKLMASALDAAADLERLLDALNLASAGRRPRPARIALEEAASHSARHLWRDARRPTVRVESGLEVQADRRLLDAALYTAGLHLQRFGPPGAPLLEGMRRPDGVYLAWSLPEPREPGGTRREEPPDLLPRVLRRLAEQLEARPVLETWAQSVPVAAGILWPGA